MEIKGKGIFIAYFIWVSILICPGGKSYAQDQPLDKTVSIVFKRVYLHQAFTQLQQQSGIGIAFDPDIVPLRRIKPLRFTRQPIRNILSYLLAGTGLTFELVAGTVVVNKPVSLIRTLNGIVYDRETGENLIGAVVQIGENKQFSNQYGYFSISSSIDNEVLSVDHPGYQKYTSRLKPGQDSYFSIGIEKTTHLLQEVSINLNITSADSIETVRSVRKLTMQNVTKVPYFGGELDVIKALQMQQGIKNPSEGSSGLSVRGGDYDQNLFLIDEAPVYNASHLFGLVSVLNIDAVKSVELYQDYIPAGFGGRLSSVIDTKLQEGSLTDYHFKGGFSLLSARLAAEGPFIKNKSSYFISVRRSLTDLLNNDYRYSNVNANYYDFNFKSNYILSKRDRVYLSLYHGFDHLYSDENFANDWTNTTMTARVNHVYTPRLFVNFSAIYSNYQSTLSLNNGVMANNEWLTGIRDVTLKSDFTYYRGQKNRIEFGAYGTRHHFKPGEAIVDDQSTILNRVSAFEYALYYDQDISFSKLMGLRYGFRGAIFNQAAELQTNVYRKSTSYYSLEPRAQLIFMLAKDRVLKFTYNRNIQNLQLLQNNEQSFSSVDTWIPSGPKVKPQKSDFLSSSFTYLMRQNAFASLSVYYRKSYNQMDLIDHAQIILNPAYEDLLRFGEAKAYGAEFSLRKEAGKFSTEIYYSYSRTFRRIKGINGDIAYPSNYDTPHDLKTSLSYRLGSRLVVSSIFNYHTGKAVTLPVGFYLNNGAKVPIYEGRNGSRFPDYSRLDFVVELNPPAKPPKPGGRRWESTWNFGVYNVYDRRNPLFYRTTSIEPAKNIGFEESFSGIVPTLSYSFRF